MKKYRGRIIALLLSVTLLLSTVPAMTFTAAAADEAYSGGNGTEKNPYKISSRDDLKAIADAVNGGDDLAGLYFEQTNNIDLGGEDDPWPVIGHVVGNTPHPFNGVYDGADCKIFGLFVGKMGEDGDPVGVENEDAGLFGHVGENGIIRRVHVVDCKVYSKALYVGGIAGRNEGLVEYCSSVATDPDISSGVIKGSWQYAGGIVGYNHRGKISYCYSNCDVLGAQKVGGITGGQNGGTVVNCYFRGWAYADDITRAYAGGIAGENDGDSTIDNCYSDGIVEGKNENAYCGAIAGSNDTGSKTENCFWDDSEETGLPGIGSGMGDVENVEKRTADEFTSGQVAWELAHGTDGDGWGQTLDDGDGNSDQHPHFTDVPDKPYDTTPIYRVTFKANYNSIDEVCFVDPGTDVEPPALPEYTKWYLVDDNGLFVIGEDGTPVEFDNRNIQKDVDAIAGERILFAGETGTVVETRIYSIEAQTLDLDLYMSYANRGPSSYGRFEYSITNDKDDLNAKLAEDGKNLIIPAGTSVKEGGYTLEILAHEKMPIIIPAAISPFAANRLALGAFGTKDVILTVNIMIEKATPVITVKPDASTIDYGKTLADSKIKGGEAQHPATSVNVRGTFSWASNDTVPTVNEAAITGYLVTFTPNDTVNYNSVTTMVTLTVNKVDPTNVKPPKAINSVYNGKAEELIEAGSADGGVMKYWLTDDPNANPPADNSEFSSTIPSRANVGTYYVWYKVIGDENHNDTEPECVTATISPYPLDIDPGHVTYNGGNTFTLALDGVKVDGEDNNRTVIATLTANSKDVGEYEYATEAGSGNYTVELSNSNYVVNNATMLTIDKLAAVLAWSDPLVFTYDGHEKQVTATVSNAIDGDALNLEYEGNKGTEEDDYIAKVTDLGNRNYTLEGAQNVTQPWHILEENERITLLETDPVTYGDELTLTVEITPDTSGIRLMAVAWDEVEFFVNGNSLGTSDVQYDDDEIKDKGTATITVKAATAEKYFSAGANAVIAEYGGNGNVKGGKAGITVTVAPKPITAAITGDVTTKIYDGNDIATGLDIALNDEEICDNGSGKDDVTVTADTYTYNSLNATEATIITANNVTLSGAQSGNYVLKTDLAITGSIEPKVVRLEWRGSTGLVYSGDPVNVNATATELIPGDECAVIVENGQETNAGDYIAEATDLDNSNYALPTADTTQDYTIEPAPLYIPEQVVIYDGTAEFTVEVDGVTPTDGTAEKVEAKFTAGSPNVGIYTYIAEGTADAEEKTYTATIDNTNYVIAGGALLIIQKADPAYTAPTAKLLTYNGQPQELVIEGTANGGEMQYSLSEDGPYSAVIPTGIEAGTYTVWYKVVGDENHNDIAPQSVEVTIAPINSDDPGNDPGNEPGDEPGEDPADDPGEQPGEAPGEDPNDGPGDKPGDGSGIDPADKPSDEPGDDPGKDPGNIPEDEPSDKPGDDPGDEPGDEPGSEPGNEPSDEPDNETGSDLANNAGNKPGGSLTSPKTGAATFAFTLLAMLTLSMFVLSSLRLTSLRKGKKSR